ncbi:MAG: MBL fold metallo-hydrolase [Clostridia bacterium]|nr:MBL fold metallo-hydrolase [Clostridia bacterium]
MFLSLVSGSTGNCSVISDGKTVLLTDCGLTASRLEELLWSIGISPENLTAILITHEHSDHIKGAGVVSKKYGLPVFATEQTHNAMKNCGISEKNTKYISPNKDFEIGTIGIKPFSIPHDAIDPVGYSFFLKNSKLSLATDIGNMNDYIFDSIRGSIAVILESNHDLAMLKNGRYPEFLKRRILGDFGHLSNKAASETVLKLLESGTRHIMLAHLSADNNTPKAAILETAELAKANGIIPGKDFSLAVAKRYEPTAFLSSAKGGTSK